MPMVSNLILFCPWRSSASNSTAFHTFRSPVDGKDMERFFSISDEWGSHPAFEGGEAETLVLEAPFYRKKVSVKGEIEEDGPYRARYRISEVNLV